MKPAIIIGLLLGGLAAGQDPPRALPVPDPDVPPVPAPAKVISRSQQFNVSGADGLVRGSVAMLAEDAKEELLQLTREKDDWKVPVSIFLHGQQGDPLPPRSVAMKLLFSEAGFGLRVDVHLSRGIEMEQFKHTITAALLYERSLRGRPPGQPETRLTVPPWLVEGLREAIAWRAKRSDRRLYEALFKRGGLFKLDELFAVDESHFEELDGAMRAAFRVSSGALLMALLEQPQGRDGFRSFLSSVAGFEGEMPALLRRHFPDLNLSETSLAKWWALQLAEMTAPSLTEVLSIAESETALEEALQLNFRSADGVAQRKPLAAWKELDGLKAAERIEAVRPAQDLLVRLSYRCFPSYRPLIAEYQIVLAAIARNKTFRVAGQLTALRTTRETMCSKANRARDYLDWFEITRARETSGVFEDYLRLKERLKAAPRNREDNLTKYLDQLDKIFARKSDDGPASPATGPPGDLPAEEPLALPGP